MRIATLFVLLAQMVLGCGGTMQNTGMSPGDLSAYVSAGDEVCFVPKFNRATFISNHPKVDADQAAAIHNKIAQRRALQLMWFKLGVSPEQMGKYWVGDSPRLVQAIKVGPDKPAPDLLGRLPDGVVPEVRSIKHVLTRRAVQIALDKMGMASPANVNKVCSGSN